MKGSHNSTLGQYAGASPSPPVQFVSNFQLKYLAQCWPAQSKTSWRVNPETWDHLLCHMCRYICVPYWWAQSCATSGWKSLHPGALLCHQLSWRSTSGCTSQLPKKYFRVSFRGLAQHGFYSAIRVLLWDSPLAMGRFLLETRLPLCHLW